MSPIAEAQKTRVYELAKEVGLDSRRLIDLLRRLGITVRNHMSTLEPEWEEKVREAIRGGPTSAPPPPPKAPAPRPAAPPPRPPVGVRPNPSAARAAVRPGLPTLYPQTGRTGNVPPAGGRPVGAQRPQGPSRPAAPLTRTGSLPSASAPGRPQASSVWGRPGTRPGTAPAPAPAGASPAARPTVSGEAAGPSLQRSLAPASAAPAVRPARAGAETTSGAPVRPGAPTGAAATALSAQGREGGAAAGMLPRPGAGLGETAARQAPTTRAEPAASALPQRVDTATTVVAERPSASRAAPERTAVVPHETRETRETREIAEPRTVAGNLGQATTGEKRVEATQRAETAVHATGRPATGTGATPARPQTSGAETATPRRGASAPYRGASAPYRGPGATTSGQSASQEGAGVAPYRPGGRGASAPYRGPAEHTQGQPRPAGGAPTPTHRGASAPYRGASAPYRGPGAPGREEGRPTGGAPPRAGMPARPARPGAGPGGRGAASRFTPPATVPPVPATPRNKTHRRGEGRTFGRGEDRLVERENFRGGLRPRKRRQAAPVRRTDRPVVIDGPVTVGALAQQMGVTAPELIRALMNLGVMATVTQEIDAETAALAVTEMGYTPELREPTPTLEEELEGEEADDPADLEPRAPVVTVMGHVDHGKTSLLDAIREANVTASEAGGITQHIGAYVAQVHGRRVVFLDTPGHEAFTSMRARGAQVTDVVILVVAADDGPMPQTLEAINHARAAGVPIVVAINKIDVPGANPERVKQALTEHGLVPEEWGGDTLMVPVSAITRTGLDDLLEAVLLVAELRELKANPHKRARGTVIEAKLDKGRGPVATILVTDGTLHVGDAFVVGAASGRVRAMFSDRGESLKDAGPSTPVEVLGLEDVPEAGDRFVVVDDERKARELAEQRRHTRRREGSMVPAPESMNLEELFRRAQQEEIRTLRLVVKADVQGSLEAVCAAVERLTNDEVQVRIVHRGVGAVTESDVMLAAASQAQVVGFNVRPDPKAARAAEQEHVSIRTYRIIYELLDDLRAEVQGLRKPVFREQVLGRAEVRQIFHLPKGGTVAGIMVLDGRIARSAQARVVRDGAVVYEGKVASLRRFKDDVREIASGYEGGVMLDRFGDVKEGDVIESFVMEEEAREA